MSVCVYGCACVFFKPYFSCDRVLYKASFMLIGNGSSLAIVSSSKVILKLFDIRRLASLLLMIPTLFPLDFFD